MGHSEYVRAGVTIFKKESTRLVPLSHGYKPDQTHVFAALLDKDLGIIEEFSFKEEFTRYPLGCPINVVGGGYVSVGAVFASAVFAYRGVRWTESWCIRGYCVTSYRPC